MGCLLKRWRKVENIVVNGGLVINLGKETNTKRLMGIHANLI